MRPAPAVPAVALRPASFVFPVHGALFPPQRSLSVRWSQGLESFPCRSTSRAPRPPPGRSSAPAYLAAEQGQLSAPGLPRASASLHVSRCEMI